MTRTVGLFFAMMLFSLNGFAAGGTLSFASNGLGYGLPGDKAFDTTGTLTVTNYDNHYSFTFVKKAGNIPSAQMFFAINNTWHNDGDGNISLSSGTNYVFSVQAAIPSTAKTGDSQDVDIYLTDGNGTRTVLASNYHVIVPALTLSGPGCLNNGPKSFTVSSYAPLGGRSITYTATNGWLINGATSTITTTATTVTITAGNGNSATLTATLSPNSNMNTASAFVAKAAPASPTFASVSDVCRWADHNEAINGDANASGYAWRWTGPTNGIKLVGGGTEVSVIGNILGSYNLYVKATNACGFSPEAMASIYVKNCFESP